MSDLNDFYDKLNAAFSRQNLSEGAKEAAIYDFIRHAREQNLSFAEASEELNNPDQVNQSVAIGEKADEYAQVPVDASPDITEAIHALRSEITGIRDAVVQFADVSQHTNTMLANIGRVVEDSHADTTDSKKVLGEVHAAAGELKTSLTQAISTTKNIVDKLDPIPARLDSQLQKMEALENGVGTATKHAEQAVVVASTVASNTAPEKTRAENLKMVGLGAIAGTLVSAAYSTLVHYATDEHKDTPPAPITLELKLAENDSCLPKDTLQKLKSGQSVTLPTGSGTVCLILPQQPQQPPPPRQEAPVVVQPLPKPVIQTLKPHHPHKPPVREASRYSQ